MRQPVQTAYDPPRGTAISTLAYEYPAFWNVPEHAHGSDQIVYATSGVMEMAVEPKLWLIPPQFAIWIPARTRHRIRMPGPVSMRTLYLRRGLVSKMPSECAVLNVVPLLRELIVEAVRLGELRTRMPLHRALTHLIVSHLQAASPIPTVLAMPRDGRARTVAEKVLAESTRHRTLAQLCKAAGTSPRTVERLFHRELGTDFETWRRQARLMRAVELLVTGHSVKQTASMVGYRQPSAFVAMFRRALGTTPKVWVSVLGKAD